MLIGASFLGYVVLHFLVYALFLRRRDAMSSERGIFLYHFIPAVSWVLGLLVACAVGDAVRVPHLVLIASLHGIYSLTFLEFWALADGGYSLAIMDCLEFKSDVDEEKIIGELEALGTAKKQQRVADLVRAGLVQTSGEAFELTPAGRVAVAAVAFIVWLARVRMSH